MNSLYIKEEPKMQDVFDFLDKCHEAKDKEIKIYMDCGGGSVSEFNVIMNRLNWMLSLGYKITVHIMYAGSAAFTFCYDFKGKVQLEQEADGMIHMTYLEIPSHGKTVIYADGTGRGRKQYYESQEQRAWYFMLPEEKELYESGKDVYINPIRMKEIFSNHLLRGSS